MHHGLDSAVSSSGITHIKGVGYNSGHFNLSIVTFFNATICAPIIEFVQQQLNPTMDGVTQRVKKLDVTENNATASRRLSVSSSSWTSDFLQLEHAMLEWWRAHDGEPSTKLTVARKALDELQFDAHRLLVMMPVAVHHVFQQHGPKVAMEMALSYYQDNSACWIVA